MVGVPVLLQQNPRDVTLEVPSEVRLPPTATPLLIWDTVAVVVTTAVAEVWACASKGTNRARARRRKRNEKSEIMLEPLDTSQPTDSA